MEEFGKYLSIIRVSIIIISTAIKGPRALLPFPFVVLLLAQACLNFSLRISEAETIFASSVDSWLGVSMVVSLVEPSFKLKPLG